jgi:hypothetical protein
VDRRPSIDIAVLTDASALTEFLAVLDWAYAQAD